MKIIVGLGNPDKKYESTRHNFGKLILKNWKESAGFPDFKLKKKLKAQITETHIAEEKIIIALPETYMNDSGKAVKLLIKFYNIKPENLIIVHDDIDIDLGKIKIVKTRGSAGHKGVQSIIDEIKTKDFIRFRIGIRPTSYTLVPKTLDEFVLQRFTKEEKEIVEKMIEKTITELESALGEGEEKTMGEFN